MTLLDLVNSADLFDSLVTQKLLKRLQALDVKTQCDVTFYLRNRIERAKVCGAYAMINPGNYPCAEERPGHDIRTVFVGYCGTFVVTFYSLKCKYYSVLFVTLTYSGVIMAVWYGQGSGWFEAFALSEISANHPLRHCTVFVRGRN
jgi:hypothetical protein